MLLHCSKCNSETGNLHCFWSCVKLQRYWSGIVKELVKPYVPSTWSSRWSYYKYQTQEAISFIDFCS
ncbi:hypothetical protein F7725_004044 [Dissostichus mawsoni]|uniref:Uncharacterized protein n=1 Tax=Dissostichus mawsoni TaxID=36200 RepID=A0A7J5YBX3_DISMA|nr:hypothetical protein F7725_004044 [Dissostichus mawsoni]